MDRPTQDEGSGLRNLEEGLRMRDMVAGLNMVPRLNMVVGLDEPGRTGSALVGGKGTALGELLRMACRPSRAGTMTRH